MKVRILDLKVFTVIILVNKNMALVELCTELHRGELFLCFFAPTGHGLSGPGSCPHLTCSFMH